MKKSGIAKKLISKVVFAGLLINSLPATLPIRAQPQPILESAMPQVPSAVQPKLSKEEIDNRIRIIKKTVKNLKTANVIISLIVTGLGILAAVGAIASITWLGSRFFKKLKLEKLRAEALQAKKLAREKLGLMPEMPARVFPELEKAKEIATAMKEIGTVIMPEGAVITPKGVITPWKWRWEDPKKGEEWLKAYGEWVEARGKIQKIPSKIQEVPLVGPIVSLLVTGLLTVSAPIAFLLLNIGITGVTLSTAFAMAGELERMEKTGQITLTGDQKRTLAQLKHWAKDPITRGLMKYFALKKALNDVVKSAMEKNRLLGATIAFGHPKRARAIIAQYIKLKWKEGNSKKAVNELDKTKEPKIYKRVVASLQKFKKQIATLEAKYTNLPKAPELKNAVQEFRAQADRILEGLKKPVLEAEIPKPAVELKPMAVPL